MEKEVNFGKLLHGGDYNPEQWLDYPEILEQDLAYFKKARINEVSLGMFSWAFLEPEEGVFRLERLKEVIDRLYENEIVVMLSTPTAARPRWMAEKYPEVLRVNAARERNLYGERHNHCYTSPVYREKTRIINTKLAEMFKDHPGVISWHISNEYGGECHCPLCQEAFRGWVKKKYGTLERLNRAWNTGFWSHTYQSFDQVESPSPKGDSSLHGLNLDWKRFVTDQTADFVKWEIKALRDAGAEQPSTINMMYNFTGLNYYKFADVIDFVSWDNYPTWHKEAETVTAMDTEKAVLSDGELSFRNELAVRQQAEKTGHAAGRVTAGSCAWVGQCAVFPDEAEPRCIRKISWSRDRPLWRIGYQGIP